MITGKKELDDLSCIVVHHNSPDTLDATLRAISAAGVPVERVLVVDNSDDIDAIETAATVSGRGFPLLRTTNRGYGAAANEGLAFLSGHGLARTFTLVATHESLAFPGAIEALRDELAADPGIAVAGPTLIDAGSIDGRIWSAGGRLTRFLKLPRHHTAIDSSAISHPIHAVDRAWLDGAFTMYRTDDLTNFGLDETYFLYFEETDLHTRLGRSGRRVVWVPRANVSQRSSGIPARLLGRNLFLFHSKLFSPARGRLAVVFELLRSVARAMLTSRGRWSALPEIASGWLSGEKFARAAAGKPADKSAAAAESTSLHD